MKLITLENLQRYDIDLRGYIKGLKIDPALIEKESITAEKLDQAIQDALAKALSALQADDIADDLQRISDNKKEADDNFEDINQKIADIEEIAAGNKTQGENNEQALINATNAISETNAAVQKLKEDENADVTSLNTAITSLQDAMDDVQGDITGIKQDIGSLDGLADLQTKVDDINDIVTALETDQLTAYVKKDDLGNELKVYVKKDELPDSIVTTMVQYQVLDDDKNVKFYTKEETPAKVSEYIGDYVEDGNLDAYVEEKTADKVTEMLLSEDGTSLNQNLLEKTSEFTQSQLTDYVDGVLSNYSTIAQTATAITNAVGTLEKDEDGNDIDVMSTITQRANAIETSVAEVKDDLVSNYYDKTATAEYASEHIDTYVDGKLSNYSTKAQTSTAISEEIAKFNDETLVTNYYTKDATAEAIKTELLADNLLTGDSDSGYATNVYTKEETASAVNTQLTGYGVLATDADGNTIPNVYTKQDVYTKEETADKITSDIQSFENGALTAYSTTEQTAEALKAHLANIGVTGEDETLLVATADEVTASVKAATDELNGSISQIDIKADGISSVVESLSETVGSNSTAITQLSDSIALCTKSTDLDGNTLISKINMGDGTVAIDGSLVHITGNTLFDDNVTIRGNMTSGSISCDDGVTISSGAVELNKNGVTVDTAIGGSILLNENGLIFTDADGNTYSQLGTRYKTGEVTDGQIVSLNWDMAPKVVLMTPKKMKTSIAGNTSNDMYIECYASNVSETGFTAVCHTTATGTTTTAPYYLTESTLSSSRSNGDADYNDVSKSFTFANLTTPSDSTKTTINGSVKFFCTGDAPTGNFNSATNGNVIGLPSSTLTVTATPNAGYELTSSDISITASTATLSSSNTYTATLGAHPNCSVVMTTDRSIYTLAGLRTASIAIYVGNTSYKTITVPVTAYTGSVTYNLNETISHSGGDTIHLVCTGTWNYLAKTYDVTQSMITATSETQDTTTTVKATGTATYLALA